MLLSAAIAGAGDSRCVYFLTEAAVPSLNEFVTTRTEESDIAAAAISGVASPAIAIGTAIAL
jgi:hypothetical protein